MGAKIEIEGRDRLVAGLTAVINPGLYQGALRLIGEEVRGRIARYPGPPKHPLRWASPRQAFYVKRILRKGRGPYVRGSDPLSQNLGGSWAVSQEKGRVVVGTRVTYAPYVQSVLHQQPFHQDTGWITDEKAVREVRDSGVIREILQDSLRKALNKR